MSKIDEMLKEALDAEDQAILDATREQGWFELGLNSFRGKLGWVTWVIMAAQVILFIVGVVFAVKTYNAVETLPAIKSGMVAVVTLLMSTQLKLSLMPKIQADRVLLELKRVELLVLETRAK